jgi:succinyl-CoA synthetase beta subunit
MNIHEYQAKQVLKQFGVPISPGYPAFSSEEAVAAAQKLAGDLWVVKAQIHAGGRGKAGGVILCRSHAEVKAAAEKLLGSVLVTHQTGPKGQVVRRLYVEQGCAIAQELYLSMLVDRQSERIAIIASAAGGVDIEEVAAKTPEKIVTFTLDPVVGCQAYHGRKLAFALGLEGQCVKQMGALFKSLYDAFTAKDMNMLEINPLVVTKEGNLIALDAKITFDDNGLYRHADIEELRDTDEEDPMETQAKEHELSYVKLEGNIGCMVNGAGLAMATMDIIKLHGGEPANFLDVGGGATQEKVAAAFKLILADHHVEAILINIFGGIMRCDVIAQGIVAAAREVSLNVPMVVRLQGTNMELGKQILRDSHLTIIAADELAEAAQKVVQAAKEAA